MSSPRHRTEADNPIPDGAQRKSPISGTQETSRLESRRWIALAVLLVAGFMDLVDVMIVNVAIPSMLRDLHAAYAQIEWVIAGYIVGFAALLITSGRLGDLYGRKRIFLIGVAGFIVASALCGLATHPAMLIGSRLLQGAMAGLMVPQILAIVHASFPADERGKALGFFGGVMGSAAVLGLILGGVLVQWNLFGLDWRPIASGLLSTTQQVGMALGIALAGVVFFTQLAHDSDRATSIVTPTLQQQLDAAGILAERQDSIVSGFRECVQERSAATDPTQVPVSCRPRPDTPPAVQRILTQAGLRANAHNFVASFNYTLWYGVATIIAVFLGIFGLPERLRESAPLDTPTS